MVSIVNSNTSAMLGLALDAATLRQQAIAQNIANANTPGYQRVAVTFESRMAQLRDSLQPGQVPSAAQLAPYRPLLEPAGQVAVALDTEMAGLSENMLHHQALLKALNKHYALLGLAISEGKR